MGLYSSGSQGSHTQLWMGHVCSALSFMGGWLRPFHVLVRVACNVAHDTQTPKPSD